jgi:hypothetical protein
MRAIAVENPGQGYALKLAEKKNRPPRLAKF